MRIEMFFLYLRNCPFFRNKHGTLHGWEKTYQFSEFYYPNLDDSFVAMEAVAHARIPLERHMIEGSISKSMELKWIRTRITKTSQQLERRSNQLLVRPPMFPIYISTDPRHVDPNRLRDLYGDCNHCCHRFPSHHMAEPVDIRKLRIALWHSAVVVSVFCKLQQVVCVGEGSGGGYGVADFLQSVTPVTPSGGELVGFGRAVSDCGLTASIYDVMVIPSLRRMGIGRMIVKKIVRMLTNREVYDIAALCSENERLFFKACGFGSDILGSTTMMYTRTASSTAQEGEQTVTLAGRKLLLVPPLKGPYESSRTTI